MSRLRSVRVVVPYLFGTISLGSLLAGCAGTPGQPTPQRPTFSQNTSTTAPGTTELEAGVSIDPGDFFDTPTTVKYGVTENSEISVSMAPYQWLERQGSDGEGIGDLFVAVRQRVIDVGPESPSVAYQMKTKIPTASEREGLGTGELDFFAAGILDYPIDDFWLTAFYQLGILGEPGGGGDPDIQHGFAFAGTAPVATSFSAYGELAAILTPERDDEQLIGTAGLTYLLQEGIVLDGGVAVGLSNDAPDFEILFGITTNFGGGGD